jgi:hypothetical protein
MPNQAGAICACLSLLTPRRHIEIAIAHNLACILVAPDLAKKYQAGEYPTIETIKDLRINVEKRFTALRKSIIYSFLYAVSILTVGLVLAVAFGKVHPMLSPDYGKVVTVFGTFLAGWGTLLGLNPPEASWKGTRLDQKVHFSVVRFLTIAGIALALFGAVWWQ